MYVLCTSRHFESNDENKMMYTFHCEDGDTHRNFRLKGLRITFNPYVFEILKLRYKELETSDRKMNCFTCLENMVKMYFIIIIIMSRTYKPQHGGRYSIII